MLTPAQRVAAIERDPADILSQLRETLRPSAGFSSREDPLEHWWQVFERLQPRNQLLLHQALAAALAVENDADAFETVLLLCGLTGAVTAKPVIRHLATSGRLRTHPGDPQGRLHAQALRTLSGLVPDETDFQLYWRDLSSSRYTPICYSTLYTRQAGWFVEATRVVLDTALKVPELAFDLLLLDAIDLLGLRAIGSLLPELSRVTTPAEWEEFCLAFTKFVKVGDVPPSVTLALRHEVQLIDRPDDLSDKEPAIAFSEQAVAPSRLGVLTLNSVYSAWEHFEAFEPANHAV